MCSLEQDSSAALPCMQGSMDICTQRAGVLCTSVQEIAHNSGSGANLRRVTALHDVAVPKQVVLVHAQGLAHLQHTHFMSFSDRTDDLCVT